MVLAVSAVAAEVFLVETRGTADVLILLAPCIALFTVADVIERRRGLLIGVAALAACVLVHALLHVGVLGPLGPQNLAFTALGALAIAAGDSSRNRRAYLAEVERARRGPSWSASRTRGAGSPRSGCGSPGNCTTAWATMSP